MTFQRRVLVASIFGDESADQHAQIVYAVAALVGPDSCWDSAVSEWLKITDGREFHATEWEGKYGSDSYNSLARVIQSSGLRGEGVALDVPAFRAAFPELTTQDYAYHKCFMEAIDRLVKVSGEQGYKDLKLTFDGRQGQGTTGLLYDSITTQKEWADVFDWADEISFENRKNPRIQIADMVARETMRGFLSSTEGKPLKEPFRILGQSDERIWFTFLVGEYFPQWRKGLPDLEKKTGLYAKDYYAFIEKKSMPDNLYSRIQFMIWHDKKNFWDKNNDKKE